MILFLFPVAAIAPHPSFNWKGVSMMLDIAALIGYIPAFPSNKT
jgi:hypothetical protein